ncbi:MAG: hypothetical protein HOO99_18385 [Hyphomicrobiaceae bacterium]|nr:hypothetical protein [Hyphomicrobiaceae bacterium]
MRFLTSKFGIALMALIAGAAAFGFFYFQLAGSEYISDPKLKTKAQIGELDACIKVDGNAGAKCKAKAESIMQGVANAQFGYTKSSKFDVFVDGDALVFLKKNCSASDLAVNSFVWAVYPSDVSVLPEARRSAGYFTGIEDFAKKGFSLNGLCLLTARFPTADYKKFEAGQYHQAQGKWDWYVN